MSSSDDEARRRNAQFQRYLSTYPINLVFPATVMSANPLKVLRTNTDLIQHRLLEAGILFDGLQPIHEIQPRANAFIENLNQTGCYNAVQFQLDDGDEEGMSKLRVVLNEKNWYRLYVGGGLKQDGIYQNSRDSIMSMVQFETSGTLINLGGHLDMTNLAYAIDAAGETSLALSHERPLYSIFKEDSMGYLSLLSLDKGSQYSFAARASLDTVDHEWTRSYKEYQRLLSVRIATGPARTPEMAESGYAGLDWSFIFRDVIPRRHVKLPYHCDASPEIVEQSGPTTKHSLTWEYRTNGSDTDNRFNPTTGTDMHVKFEVAGPPGDVGFVKAEGGYARHLPLSKSLALHSSFSTGILYPVSFGDVCGAPTVSDRFHIDGPLQLRGFLPSGIGPRAKTGGASVAGGDALGGDMFYTATVAASVPLQRIPFLESSDLRLFGFANAGTLTGMTMSLSHVMQSTRVAVGGGFCMGSPIGRAEVTCAMPLRYGPRDARRTVQWGIGMRFG